MTDITPLIPQDSHAIDSYGDGGFTISGERHEGAVIILPDGVQVFSVGSVNDLLQQVFTEVFVERGLEVLHDIELLLLGCGTQAEEIDRHLRVAFNEHNIAVEVMDTGAACRTYNVLMAEGRAVAAALVAV